MVQPKQMRRRRNRGKRSLKGGDIPKPADHTYHTMSCRIPAVTETCVVRGTQKGTWTVSASATQAPTFYFALTNFNVGTGFWDQYRLEAIRFTVSPSNNAIGLFTNSSTSVVPLTWVIDYDDANALASQAAGDAYSTCLTLNPGESAERTFRPRMAMAAYSGAFSSYANVEPQWIDSASDAVQHYGCKFWIPQATVSQTQLQSWNYTVEGFFTMRKSI